MKISQIYAIMNTVTSEVLGRENVVLEDLTNIVDVGTEIINSDNVDSYVKALVNHIGKVAFAGRLYKGRVLSVVKDAWEFGSVLEKISMELPEAEENSEYNLVDGQSYDTGIFHAPKVSALFFNKKVTFEIPMSFTTRQVKASFSNINQLNGFISMINTTIENSMNVKMESLILRCLNSMIGESIQKDYADDKGVLGDLTAKSGVKAINLLYLYNTLKGTTITKDKALTDTDFIKYATYMIGIHCDRMTAMSTLFNIGAKERFTPIEDLNCVMLSDFRNSITAYLEADTFNKELIQLPKIETVPYWQGSGKNYEITEVSKVNVKTGSGKTVVTDGILAVLYDKETIGVSNLDKRVTTSYNAKGEFYNNYYKFESGYYTDLNENFVVFFIA